MGQPLREKGRPRRGEAAQHARLLGVSERTLRKWRTQALALPVMGRPRLARKTWRAALLPARTCWRC